MSPAASSKSCVGFPTNSGLPYITEVHSIISPVNNTKACKSLILFSSAMLLHGCYKGSSCPATLGPTAVVHVTHPGILQGNEHPPHTQRLWSEINLKDFFSSIFLCISVNRSCFMTLLLLYSSGNNNHDRKFYFLHHEVQASFK